MQYEVSRKLKMVATCSTEPAAEFHRAPRRYIPEDRNLYIPFTYVKEGEIVKLSLYQAVEAHIVATCLLEAE
jgi:hypothetical protein